MMSMEKVLNNRCEKKSLGWAKSWSNKYKLGLRTSLKNSVGSLPPTTMT